ncbi:MAG: porin [Desulfosarcinaceae bacterium]|nr:porin [Desulfosarcinaceae bacterium]
MKIEWYGAASSHRRKWSALRSWSAFRGWSAFLCAWIGMMVIIGLATTTWAVEKSVSEEILDIMKDRGDINTDDYEALKKKAAAEREASTDWKAYWKSGLRVERTDGRFKSRWGGRVMLDWAAIDSESDFEEQLEAAGESAPLKGNGVEFRRIRLFTDGLIDDAVGYKVQVDFVGQDVDLKDIYLQRVNVPLLGRIRVGHFKEAFSLEEQTSSKYITFMERSLPVAAFAPGRNTGLGVGHTAADKRLRWDLGVFYDVGDDGDFFADYNNFQVTARAAGQPWYQDKRHFLHVGLGYSHLFRDEDEADARLRFRARPEAHITDVRLANTGRFLADNADKLNPEVALVYGPFSIQGEYFLTLTDASDVDDPTFQGWYAFGSWFITGESRSYKQSSASFDRVKPNNDFVMDGSGWGAWELAARYSTVDLSDEAIEGGEQTNITGGLNWYMDAHTRLMLNYVYADLEDRDEVEDNDASIVQARFQIDF